MTGIFAACGVAPLTKILMAAIRFDGKAYGIPAPARHSHILERMIKQYPDLPADFGEDQGFITDAGAFVGRAEAWWLAAAAEQIPRTVLAEPRELFSEDLW